MYRPNFCAECGAQILRERWHFWTSRSFCADCSTRFRKERILLPLLTCAALFATGLLAGRTARQAAPPLLVERATLPLAPAPSLQVKSEASPPASAPGAVGQQDAMTMTGTMTGTMTERAGGAEEAVYICGARTQKGTPCSRRVRGTGRCWQHLGMPAMIPLEKRLVARK